jgi:hypothetical protein
MSDITAIVNIFRRPHVLDNQIEAIKNQSIPPKSIFIWNNGNNDVDLTKYKNDPLFRVFDNNYNSGVWSRFIISQLAATEYICIFDDDTIPGNNWFKNCLQSMQQKEALYGTIGVIFKNESTYQCLKRYGWDGPSNVSKPVDIVGHSWFFKKIWLSYFMRDSPHVNEKFNVGEDMWFSYMLQKYANIPTYVPPHPVNDISMYGSIPKTAWKYGCDGNSGSNDSVSTVSSFDKALLEYRNNGFKIFMDRQNANSVDDFNEFIKKINHREPFALIRPADGEYQILQNTTLTNIDNWTFVSNGKLAGHLKEAIELGSKKNCYIGIPCGTCNMNMAKWYVNSFNLHPLYTTFANVFVNKNWREWINFLQNSRTPFVFIGPGNLPNTFCVQKHITIPLLLVNTWDSDGDTFLNKILVEIKKYKNTIFLFSSGPISKIVIAHAWNQHPYNIYLDIGSSLDIFVKGSSNREYVINGSPLSQNVCRFDHNVIQL